MRRVLMTGASGAVGRAVLDRLLSRGWEVAVLLRNPAAAWRLAGRLDHVTVIRGDMEDLTAVRPDIERFAADTVIHLAWDGVTATSRNAPSQVRNLANSVALLEMTATFGAGHFIGFGSQAEYGSHADRISEEAQARPDTVYGTVKLSTGMIAQRIATVLGVRLTWLRLFATYGPFDNPGFLLPRLITTLLRAERLPMTAGDQQWDYLHFDDVACAVDAVIETRAVGTFNLGSGQPRKLRDIACIVRNTIDPCLPLGLGDVAYQPDQVMHLEADIAALSRAAGWRPQISLDTGLIQTVEWYRDNAS